MAPDSASAQALRERHWRLTRRLTLILLGIWFAVTFGVVFLARSLSEVVVFGGPISYYVAAQGTTLAYLLLVAAYIYGMRRLDRMLESGMRDGE